MKHLYNFLYIEPLSFSRKLTHIDKATTIEIHAATAAGDMLMFKTHAAYTMTQPMIGQQCVFDIQLHATYLILHYAT